MDNQSKIYIKTHLKHRPFRLPYINSRRNLFDYMGHIWERMTYIYPLHPAFIKFAYHPMRATFYSRKPINCFMAPQVPGYSGIILELSKAI